MDFILILISAGLIILIFRKHYLLLKKEQMLSAALSAPLMPEQTEAAEPQASPLPPAEKSSLIDYGKVNSAFRKADYYFARGDWQEAERWFVKVLSLYPDHEEALNRLGVIYIQNGTPHKAELLYRRLLTLNPKEAVYYSNFGRCLYNQKKYEAAANAYEAAVNLDPGRPARYVSLGQIYYEMKDVDKALDNFLKAFERDQRNLQYMQLIADLYELRDDRESQKLFLQRMLELDPYNERVKVKLDSLMR